jgi:hypothetical protein
MGWKRDDSNPPLTGRRGPRNELLVGKGREWRKGYKSGWLAGYGTGMKRKEVDRLRLVVDRLEKDLRGVRNVLRASVDA